MLVLAFSHGWTCAGNAWTSRNHTRVLKSRDAVADAFKALAEELTKQHDLDGDEIVSRVIDKVTEEVKLK